MVNRANGVITAIIQVASIQSHLCFVGVEGNLGNEPVANILDPALRTGTGGGVFLQRHDSVWNCGRGCDSSICLVTGIVVVAIIQ